MATTFELKIACSEERARAAERILADCHELIEKLENQLTEFRAQSPVARLNEAPQGKRVDLPENTWELFQLSLGIETLTEGAFSAAAKSGPEQPKKMQSRFGWDERSRQAWRLDEQAHLGFGAIGKGFALDRCRALLALHGFENFLFSGGGSSILLSGHAPLGQPWRWGWSWSKGASGEQLGLQFEHASGTPIAIGVSGTHEKGLHLIDPRPRQGERRAQGLSSALVAHPSAAMADALSTALFVAGWDAAISCFSAVAVPPGMAVIGLDGVPRWNGVFQACWGPIP